MPSTFVSLKGGQACPNGQVALWRRGALCDATIRVSQTSQSQSRSFSVHRTVLAGASDFMCALFTANMSDSLVPKISEMRPDVFECALEWMYTGECSPREEWLGELLEAHAMLINEQARCSLRTPDACLTQAATRLQLSSCLRKLATAAIAQRATPENVPPSVEQRCIHSRAFFPPLLGAGAGNMGDGRKARLPRAGDCCQGDDAFAIQHRRGCAILLGAAVRQAQGTTLRGLTTRALSPALFVLGAGAAGG